jgi:hypothetical protein
MTVPAEQLWNEYGQSRPFLELSGETLDDSDIFR